MDFNLAYIIVIITSFFSYKNIFEPLGKFVMEDDSKKFAQNLNFIRFVVVILLIIIIGPFFAYLDILFNVIGAFIIKPKIDGLINNSQRSENMNNQNMNNNYYDKKLNNRRLLWE